MTKCRILGYPASSKLGSCRAVGLLAHVAKSSDFGATIMKETVHPKFAAVMETVHPMFEAVKETVHPKFEAVKETFHPKFAALKETLHGDVVKEFPVGNSLPDIYGRGSSTVGLPSYVLTGTSVSKL